MTDFKHVEEQIAMTRHKAREMNPRESGSINLLNMNADTMQALLDVARAAEPLRMAGRLGRIEMDDWEVFRDSYDALAKLQEQNDD
jgi:hypothetical protein